MLDERTANLDQDLSTLIYSVIKEKLSKSITTGSSTSSNYRTI